MPHRPKSKQDAGTSKCFSRAARQGQLHLRRSGGFKTQGGVCREKQINISWGGEARRFVRASRTC
eukprot:6589400-Pyramimonas_sp.AAC.1